MQFSQAYHLYVTFDALLMSHYDIKQAVLRHSIGQSTSLTRQDYTSDYSTAYLTLNPVSRQIKSHMPPCHTKSHVLSRYTSQYSTLDPVSRQIHAAASYQVMRLVSLHVT